METITNSKQFMQHERGRDELTFTPECLTAYESVKTGPSMLNLDTKKGQRRLLAVMLTVTTLPLVALIATTSIYAYSDGTLLAEEKILTKKILLSIEIANVIHYIQIERGTTALYISSNKDLIVLERLQESYLATNNAIRSLSSWPDQTPASRELYHFNSHDSFELRIQEFRYSLVASNKSFYDAIRFYTDQNTILEGFVAESTQISQDFGTIWKELVSFHMLLLSKEDAGIERALGGIFYAQGV